VRAMALSSTRPRSSSRTPMLPDEQAWRYKYEKDNDEDNKANDPRTEPPATASGRQGADDDGYDVILRRRLAKARYRKDLATFRLNQVDEHGGDIANLRQELQSAIEGVTRLLLISDPAHLLDEVMSDETRSARAAYMQKLAGFETSVKASRTRHGWNLVAGGIGNLLCFGMGNTVSILSGSTVAGAAVNMVAWTFAEPLISMLRATTFTNPCLDRYMVRQRLQARAVREWLDGTAELEKNRRFLWRDPGTGEEHWLNAAGWLGKTSWLGLWKGKYMTDDIPYYGYSVAFAITNLMPEIAGMPLYDVSTATGLATSIATRVGAGMAAGALIQARVQQQRAARAGETGGAEVVTKTRSLWGQEAAYLALLLNDIDSKRNAPDIDPLERATLLELRHSIQLWHDKAVAKSGRRSSILYEWRAMWQTRREAMGIDREVPGKRLDTAAGIAGKGLCQVAGIAVGALGAHAIKSATRWERWAGHLVPPLAAIGAAGFINRRELEVVARVMFDVATGAVNRCGCRAADEG